MPLPSSGPITLFEIAVQGGFFGIGENLKLGDALEVFPTGPLVPPISFSDLYGLEVIGFSKSNASAINTGPGAARTAFLRWESASGNLINNGAQEYIYTSQTPFTYGAEYEIRFTEISGDYSQTGLGGDPLDTWLDLSVNRQILILALAPSGGTITFSVDFRRADGSSVVPFQPGGNTFTVTASAF